MPGVHNVKELSAQLESVETALSHARRERVRDRVRRRTAGFWARIADWLAITAAASAERKATRRWNRVAAFVRHEGRMWIQARAIALATASRERSQHRAYLVATTEQLNANRTHLQKLLELATHARDAARLAKSRCSSASSTSFWGAVSSSSTLKALSSFEKSSAGDALQRAKQAVGALRRAMPATQPLSVKAPNAYFAFLMDFWSTPASNILSVFDTMKLNEAAAQCQRVDRALASLMERLQQEQLSIGRTYTESAESLRVFDAPFVKAAMSEAPANVRRLIGW